MQKTRISQKSLAEQHFSPSFKAYGLRDAKLDPFINVDLFSMSMPTFPPHPHAGFSAVTYMLPESRGAFSNRDSLGASNRIAPGDTHWTRAGSGIIHEEIPQMAGTDCLGAQIFVKLPMESELIEPRAFHLSASATPIAKGEGWQAKVVIGTLNETVGGLPDVGHDVLLADVTMEPDARAILRVQEGSVIWAVVRSGDIYTDEHGAGAVSSVFWGEDGDEVVITAGGDGAKMLLGGGVPLSEPFLFEGPFALSSRQRLSEAKRRYANGAMGTLEPSF